MGTPIDRSITFAGAGQQVVPSQARFCRVLACDASGVTLNPGSGGSGLLCFAGQDIDASAPVKDWLVSVTVACTVRLRFSDTRQADNATNITATVSATVTPAATISNGGDVVCANAAATQLVAGSGTTLSVVIRSSAQNSYAAGSVRIGTTGVTAASGIELNVGESMVVDATAPVFAYNNSGAAVTLQTLPLST